MANLAALVAVGLVVMTPASTSASSSGLVAAYSFDEGSGTTVTDTSGNGNNGTASGTDWTSGKHSGALSFNGTSSMVTVPDSPSLHLSTAMTVEAWVDPTTVGSTWADVIYKGNDNYYLEATTTKNADAPGGGGLIGGSYGEAFGPAALTPDTWTHLAVTYDGADVRLYVNGTQVADTPKTGSILTSTNALQIGGDSVYGQFFHGAIDDVRIYDTALSAGQIQTDMTTGVPPPAGGGGGGSTGGGGGGSSPFNLSPANAELTVGESQQLTASASVTWSVDGVAGGNASVGTITSAGLYTAPGGPGTHTITATTPTAARLRTRPPTSSNYAGTFTFHNDNMRSGENLDETVLTPANVDSATFGKLYSYPLDGLAISSPLYVRGVSVPGKGAHNIVYIATEHDSVYAYDADSGSTTPLWKAGFIDPANGVTTVPAGDTGECCDIAVEIGITSTPVIDPSTNTMYVVAKTKESLAAPPPTCSACTRSTSPPAPRSSAGRS